jgi:hypothetical protein
MVRIRFPPTASLLRADSAAGSKGRSTQSRPGLEILCLLGESGAGVVGLRSGWRSFGTRSLRRRHGPARPICLLCHR